MEGKVCFLFVVLFRDVGFVIIGVDFFLVVCGFLDCLFEVCLFFIVNLDGLLGGGEEFGGKSCIFIFIWIFLLFVVFGVFKNIVCFESFFFLMKCIMVVFSFV